MYAKTYISANAKGIQIKKAGHVGNISFRRSKHCCHRLGNGSHDILHRSDASRSTLCDHHSVGCELGLDHGIKLIGIKLPARTVWKGICQIENDYIISSIGTLDQQLLGIVQDEVRTSVFKGSSVMLRRRSAFSQIATVKRSKSLPEGDASCILQLQWDQYPPWCIFLRS